MLKNKKPLSDEYKCRETRGFITLAEGIDVNGMLDEINKHPELWDKFNYRRTAPNTPHAGMTDIWIRTNDLSKIGKEWSKEHYPIWYPSVKVLPAVKSFCMDLMGWVRGEHLGHVMITKVPAGNKILRHNDRGWHPEFFEKFYLQLQGAEGQTFNTDDHSFTSKTGDLYWFNNERAHWVNNDSDVDRITLIICIKIDHD
jgi:hypothetical protein